MPRCTGLTADGLVKIIQFLHECKGTLSRVRLHGICRMTNLHLDAINSLICRSSQQQDAQALYYNHRVHEVLNTDDSRPIDVDVCPLCRNVRLVFDCTRKDCRSVLNLGILSVPIQSPHWKFPKQSIGRTSIVIPSLLVHGSIVDLWQSLVSLKDICLHMLSYGCGIADLGVT